MPSIGDAAPAGNRHGYATVVANVAGDNATILALWRHGLTQHNRPEAKLDWYYRRNPEGVPDVFFLCHGNHRETVGVASLARRRFRFGSEMLTMGQAMDFVVEPKHRTFFPAMFLQKEISRRALETCEIRFGLPNTKSLAVFRRVGYQCVGQMVRHVRVLRSAGYLSRYIPAPISSAIGAIVDYVRLSAIVLRRLAIRGFRSQWLDRPDSRFDDLWQRIASPGVLIGVRDREFLAWRFVDCPFWSYRFFALVSEIDQQLVAYAVCEVKQQGLYVRDFLADPTVPGARVALWLDLSREAFHLGYKSLSVTYLGGAELRRELSAAGFVAREQRPLYAAATERWAGLMQDRHWYLTCADEDE